MHVAFKPGTVISWFWRSRFRKFLFRGKIYSGISDIGKPDFGISDIGKSWLRQSLHWFHTFRSFRSSEIRVRKVGNSGLFSAFRGGSATLVGKIPFLLLQYPHNTLPNNRSKRIPFVFSRQQRESTPVYVRAMIHEYPIRSTANARSYFGRSWKGNVLFFGPKAEEDIIQKGKFHISENKIPRSATIGHDKIIRLSLVQFNCC